MLKAANITIDDANLEIGPQGIRVASMDSEHWTMVSLFIPAEAFDEYDVLVPFTVCFDINETLTLLFGKSGKNRKYLKDIDLSLVFKEDVIEAEIIKGSMKTAKTIRLLEPLEEELPEPKIIFKAETHITLHALKQAIDDCTVNELFTVKADDDGIRFTCTDGGDWLEENYLEKHDEEILRLTVEGTQTAQYRVEHFKGFVKGLKPLSELVTLEYSSDMPMKLTAWLTWVNAQLVYYSAPKIIEGPQIVEIPVEEPQAIEAPVEEPQAIEPVEDSISFYQALEDLGFFAYSGEDGDLYRKHGLGGWRVQVYWGTDLAIQKKVHDWAGKRWITGADFDQTHEEDKAKVMKFVEKWINDPSILDERVKDYNPLTLEDLKTTETPVEEAPVEAKTRYHFYMDPGHGWLKVPIKELVELGIAGKISPYSYVHGENAYLEEDCDAPLFLKALKELNQEPKIEEHTANSSSSIRGYQPYNPDDYREEEAQVEDIEDFDALDLSPEERQALETMYDNYMIDVFGKEDQLTPEQREQLINQDLVEEIFPDGSPVEEPQVEETKHTSDYQARCAAASAAVDEIYRQYAEDS
jgi:hypothetical protein